jgi:lambda family phage portal protein
MRAKKAALNPIEKALAAVSPSWGRDRLKYKMIESFYGSSTTRRQLSQWSVSVKDADSDLLYELPRLRARSRDLVRNNPLAAGAINTNVTNIVGDGLKMRSRVDREVLGFTDEQADALDNQIEREWKLFADSKDCSVSRNLNFDGVLNLTFRSMLENGDVFTLFPRISRKNQPYSLRLQTIEGDRVSNPGYIPNSDNMRGGVQISDQGAPEGYYIEKTHPGSVYATRDRNNWNFIPAYGRNTGLPNIIHLFDVRRPGQTRGVPYLAPVIESLKMLGRYTEAEIMAAVISGMFTVFIKSESDDFLDAFSPTSETGSTASDEDYKMGPGAMIGLAPDESIDTANPGRPNTSFDPFVQAILRQIGVALEIPFELLIKHFTASYSAARAAMLEAWKMFRTRRKWLVDNFCNPVYEIWFYEAVSKGRIKAPGFFTDPIIRRAYLSNEWIGSAPGQIDPLKEVNAAEKRLNLKLTSRTYEAAQLNGSDWEKVFHQVEKEEKLVGPVMAEPTEEIIDDENGTDEGEDIENT